MGFFTVLVIFFSGLICGSIGLVLLLIAIFHAGEVLLNKSLQPEDSTKQRKMKHLEARKRLPKPKAVPVILPPAPLTLPALQAALVAGGLSLDTDYGLTTKRKLIFEVTEAKEIVASDLPKKGKDQVDGAALGTSDPYVKLRLGDQRLRTKTITKTLSPVWQQQFVFKVDDQHFDKVDLELFDAEKLGHDDPLGVASFSLQTLLRDELVDTWLPLTGKAKTDRGEVDATGSIHIKAMLLNWGDEVPVSLDLPDKPQLRVADTSDDDGSDSSSDEWSGELQKAAGGSLKRSKSTDKSSRASSSSRDSSKSASLCDLPALETTAVASGGLGGLGDMVARSSSPRRRGSSATASQAPEIDESILPPQFFPCKIKIKDKNVLLGFQGYLFLCVKGKDKKKTEDYIRRWCVLEGNRFYICENHSQESRNKPLAFVDAEKSKVKRAPTKKTRVKWTLDSKIWARMATTLTDAGTPPEAVANNLLFPWAQAKHKTPPTISIKLKDATSPWVEQLRLASAFSEKDMALLVEKIAAKAKLCAAGGLGAAVNTAGDVPLEVTMAEEPDLLTQSTVGGNLSDSDDEEDPFGDSEDSESVQETPEATTTGPAKPRGHSTSKSVPELPTLLSDKAKGKSEPKLDTASSTGSLPSGASRRIKKRSLSSKDKNDPTIIKNANSTPTGSNTNTPVLEPRMSATDQKRAERQIRRNSVAVGDMKRVTPDSSSLGHDLRTTIPASAATQQSEPKGPTTMKRVKSENSLSSSSSSNPTGRGGFNDLTSPAAEFEGPSPFLSPRGGAASAATATIPGELPREKSMEDLQQDILEKEMTAEQEKENAAAEAGGYPPLRRVPADVASLDPTAINLILQRFFVDMQTCEVFSAEVMRKITSKLDTVDLPSFIGKLQFVNLNWGKSPPEIRALKAAKTNNQNEVLVELEAAYAGGASAKLRTEVYINFPRPKTAVIPVEAFVTVTKVHGKLHVTFPEDVNTRVELCFIESPELECNIHVDLGKGRRISSLPKLKSFLFAALRKVIHSFLVYPHRIGFFFPLPGRKPDPEILGPKGKPADPKQPSRNSVSSKARSVLGVGVSESDDAQSCRYMALKFIDVVLNQAHLDKIETMCTPDVIVHGTSLVEVPLQGRDAMISFVQTLRGAFPNIKFYVEDCFMNGANVTIRWVSRTSFLGPFYDYEPTGEEILLRGMFLFKVKEGNQWITEFYNFWSLPSMYPLV